MRIAPAGSWLEHLATVSPFCAAVRRRSPARRVLGQMAAFESRFRGLPDKELRRTSLALQYRAFSGECLRNLLPEAFALVREASERTMGKRQYDVQVLGGVAIHARSVAEMQTGEGKTLTAMLPLYLAAVLGKGAHLATANDYLAERDATLTRDAYGLLGMSVGVIQASTARPERQRAYACDITYGAAREFGFDFLRDRMLAGRAEGDQRDLLGRMLGHGDKGGRGDPIQRELHFMLVDEADSILIDEARTPLIVSTLPGNSQHTAAALYRWSAKQALKFEEPGDFEHDVAARSVTLKATGRQLARALPREGELSAVPLFDLYEHIERAVLVQRSFRRDQQYIVRDGEVVIVDENTGRLAEGRKWRDGLHQAVEAREGLEVTVETGEAARVTVQDFFRRYERLAGMTGTVASSSGELQQIYELRTQVIPTNRPVQRVVMHDRVLPDADAKWQTVAEEARRINATGRPVLIGTRSIEKSQHLSQLLSAAGVEHEVLNAHRHAEEAAIVATAGHFSKVTVATNMAGRGTDIELEEGVAELGGLHVIGTELHESARIDRQLMGRCGRQGDPGSFQQFMALDDEILVAGLGLLRATRFRRKCEAQSDELDNLAGVFRKAQRSVEQQHFRQRRMLLYHEKRRRESQREMGQDPYLDPSG